MKGTVHGLFERQARETPDAVALVFGDRRVSYRELEAKSAGIARVLRERNVGPETVVGICGPRSPDTVAALLGALRAGAAYTSLDSRDPPERIRSIVDNAQIGVLLSAAEGLSAVRPAIDVLGIAAIGETSGPGAVDVCGDNLALVIQTSGSSGRPKSLALTHRSIVSRLTGPTAHVPIEPRLQKTSFGLIGHVTDLLAPLVHGWPSVLIDDDTARNPPALVDVILRHDVHRLFLVPSMLRLLLGVPESRRLRGQLQTVLVSGDRLTRDLVERVRECFPEAALVNAYGLTETAGTVCHAVVGEGGEVRIGRPPEGTVEIVNDALERVEPGEVGEIAVSGPSLARGYLNDPGLTAERFRPNPFVPGTRICLTGDLGRRLPDGAIEWHGRRDREVKLHGLRVNLPDVEQALEGEPEVDHAAVVLDENGHGDAVLTAYLALKVSAPAFNTSQLRKRMRGKLPDFMVPARFRVLERMPLLRNGKIDRQRLASVGTGNSDPLPGAAPFPQARVPGDTEAALGEIWAAELGYAAGRTSDDFFALGGDSLTAIRVGLRIQRRWGIQTPLQAVLEHATLREMAQWIDVRPRDAALSVVSTSRPEGADDGLQVLSLQQKASLAYELARRVEAGRNTQPQVRVGLRIAGNLDPGLIEESANAVIARHEILRTSYRPVVRAGPVRLEGWTVVREAVRAGRVSSGKVSWETTLHEASCLKLRIEDLRHLGGGALENALRATIEELLDEPFDCGNHPLMRAWLVRLSITEHRLLIVMPHMVADGWSLGILLRELFGFYIARREGVVVSPRPVLQYAQYARYQSERLAATRRRIAAARHPKVADSPLLEAGDLGFRRPESRDVIGLAHYEAGYESRAIPAEDCDGLRAASGRARVTLSMFVFSGFTLYLYLWSGKEQFRVTITQANRTHPDLENVFGFIASGQRVAVRYVDDPPFGSVLEQVRSEFSEAALRHEVDAADHTRHGIGFEFNRLGVQSVAGLSVERFRMRARQRAEFGLKLRIGECPDGLVLGLEYCVDCFARAAMASVLRALGTTLERAAANPSRPVSDLAGDLGRMSTSMRA